jgi:hypothetical protein
MPRCSHLRFMPKDNFVGSKHVVESKIVVLECKLRKRFYTYTQTHTHTHTHTHTYIYIYIYIYIYPLFLKSAHLSKTYPITTNHFSNTEPSLSRATASLLHKLVRSPSCYLMQEIYKLEGWITSNVHTTFHKNRLDRRLRNWEGNTRIDNSTVI